MNLYLHNITHIEIAVMYVASAETQAQLSGIEMDAQSDTIFINTPNYSFSYFSSLKVKYVIFRNLSGYIVECSAIYFFFTVLSLPVSYSGATPTRDLAHFLQNSGKI